MKVQKILVPVDFSVCSFLLAEEVTSLSTSLGAEVVFLHVMEMPSGLKADTVIHPKGQEQGIALVDYLTSEAKGYMDRYLAITKAVGVKASFELKYGPTVDVILEGAKEFNADLIMMGTHGRQGLTRLMLGSVAENVLRQSEIPVLTIRSLHKPHCEASSCATCTSGFTDAEQQAVSEVSG